MRLSGVGFFEGFAGGFQGHWFVGLVCFVYFWLLVGMIMILAGEFFSKAVPLGFIKKPRRST